MDDVSVDDDNARIVDVSTSRRRRAIERDDEDTARDG